MSKPRPETRLVYVPMKPTSGALPTFLSVESTRLERIIGEIRDLDEAEKDDLFHFLHQTYHFRFEREHSEFERPWKDPRNGFGPQQNRLLDFLDGRGCMDELTTICVLYGTSGTPQPGEYKTLRDRLRQLQSAANARFLKLKFDWKIDRPKHGHLELKRLQKF
jgi:hypothetical protein